MYIHTIDHVGLIYSKNHKILLIKPQKTKEWSLPGGKLEENETYAKALLRTVGDQLEIDIMPQSIKFLKTYVGQSYGQAGGIKIKLTCFQADLAGHVRSTVNNYQTKFLSFNQKEHASTVSQMVFNDLRDQGIIS